MMKIDELIFLYIENNAHKISNTFNIKEIVTEAIEKWSDAEIEHQVRDIADNQLKMLTYFGAGLGFVIGLLYFIISNWNKQCFFNLTNELLSVFIFFCLYFIVFKKFCVKKLKDIK
jgi:hypothetical protein